jgi:hypothetical protein
MTSFLLSILAVLPLAQVLLGCVVLRQAAAERPVAIVGPDVLRSMAARAAADVKLARLRRISRVLGVQPKPDPLRVNRRREPGARLEAASVVERVRDGGTS